VFLRRGLFTTVSATAATNE